MTQNTSRSQLKEKARDQMAGHYGNAILLSICRSLIVFSLTFAVSLTLTMVLTVRTLMAGSAEAANALGKMPTITVRMAIAVIGILPLMIIFPFFQSYFARGMTVGAVKG